MYCPNCNKAFPDNHAFCDTCGGKLVNEHANAAPPPSQTYQPVPNYAPQPAYTAPSYPYPNAAPTEHPVTMGKWFGIFCINLIPGIGSLIYLIMLFVWAFGDPKEKSLKNWAKATLLFMLVMIIVGIIIALFLVPTIMDILYNLGFDTSMFEY